MADSPPSPEQDAEVMEAVDILTTLNKASSYRLEVVAIVPLPPRWLRMALGLHLGTSLEGLHIHLLSLDRIGDQNWWREHYMPNYPCGYRSRLSRLMTDEMECGGVMRDHCFSREEVAIGGGGREEGTTA
jgi:hypothetical protein